MRPVSARLTSQQRDARTRGTAAVELVLMLPLLLLLLAVAVDLGHLLAAYHTVSKSTQDAARYLSRLDEGTQGLVLDCAGGTLSVESPAARAARRLVMTGRIDGDAARMPLVRGWTAATLSPEATGVELAVECLDNAAGALAGAYATRASVASLAVSARVPVPLSFARLAGLDTVAFTVTRRAPHTGRSL